MPLFTCYPTKSAQEVAGKEYDYIVVGGAYVQHALTALSL